MTALAAIASKRGALADMDKAAIDVAKALTRLSALTIFELRGEWRRFHRTPPPMRLSRDLLIPNSGGQNCTPNYSKSRSGSSRRRQGRDSRPRQQKSTKARETHIVNGLTPDFSHGLLDLCTCEKSSPD